MATRTKLKPTLFAGSLVLTCAASPLVAASPELRTDLQESLAPLLCKKPQGRPPSAAELWSHQIFDADISIHHVRRRPTLAAHDTKKLAKLAYSFALRNRHLGFNYGVCNSDSGWIASVPAPQPLEKSPPDFQVPMSAYEQHCQQLYFDFAAALGPTPVNPTPETLSLNGERRLVLPTRPGMVSIACQPSSPSWLGPKPWFLIPTANQREGLLLPAAGSLANNQPADLLGWVNAVRASAKLTALAAASDVASQTAPAALQAVGLAASTATPSQTALVNAATTLALSASLDHDRALLQTLGRSLQKQGWQALGENRVRGASMADMATLLWYSPRHRRLLLNREATHMSYALQQSEAGFFLVMLLAKKADLVISRNGQASPAKGSRGAHAGF